MQYRKKTDHNEIVEVVQREFGVVGFTTNHEEGVSYHTIPDFDARFEPIPRPSLEELKERMDRLRRDPLMLIGLVFAESPTARELLGLLANRVQTELPELLENKPTHLSVVPADEDEKGP